MENDDSIKRIEKVGDYYHIKIGMMNADQNFGGYKYAVNENLHKELSRINKMRNVYCQFGPPMISELMQVRATPQDVDFFRTVEVEKVCALATNHHIRYDLADHPVWVAQFKPAGPMGKFLQDMLDNNMNDIYFGARCFLDPKPNEDGSHSIKGFVTYDLMSKS